jgi:TolB-like protein/class 3 adenylate cyclase/Tfp pilus assembly protein PilF
MFTDIEGSTRLWETQRAAMEKALKRHDVLLRKTIEQHKGHLVKTTGDGACAAFESATDALQASVAAQQALGIEQWPDPVRIRVRMALHTGPAEFRDGDYYGPTPNRAARLLALGNGGQTLVSAITEELCRDYLPPGVSLECLGEHTLKDIDRRESVFEVRHIALPRILAPLRDPVAPAGEGVRSIAVLPFVNMSKDAENEYFADGLAEELLNVLAKIRGLQVAARSSSFHFKGKDVTIAEVGRALNVATVLEGSVRTSRDRMRATVQLINVADGFHLWSESYDRALEDILAVQDDIAQAVVAKLRSTLLGEPGDATAPGAVKAEVALAAQGRSTDPEAHRLYLQARHLLDRHTRDETKSGIGYLEEALRLDPDYALAWAELCRAYAGEADRGFVPVDEGYGRARVAVERALALKPDLAEGHARLGWIRMSHDWDWRGAEQSFARALELAPGNSLVLRLAGVLARNLGRPDEAIFLTRRALEQDPLGATAYVNLAMALISADRFAEAESACEKALALAPRSAMTSAVLSLTLLAQGRSEEALPIAEREPHDAVRLWALATIYHASGRPSESDAALLELKGRFAADSAYQIAETHAARGEVDDAFAWLERARVQRDTGLISVKAAPSFRSLYGDPRWEKFIDSIGLAVQYATAR